MAWTMEEFGKFILDVMNYGEDQGLDPIGASDMLSDLHQFAHHTALARLQLDPPSVIWSEFLESNRYKRYWEGAPR